MDELRLAVRRLGKRRGSTFGSIATLAAAIGASAATWAVLSAVLIHPLPVRDADGLLVMAIERASRLGPIVSSGFVYPQYVQVRESGAFAQTVAQSSSPHLLLVHVGDVPSRTDVQFVTHDFFDVVGVSMALGREFAPDDDRRGAAAVAVLTYRYWGRQFNFDPSVLGRSLRVSGRTATIVGVLEKGFRGLTLTDKPDLYLPFHTIADVVDPNQNYFADARHPSSPSAGTMIVGRLAPGAKPADARAHISSVDSSRPIEGPSARLLLVPANVAAIPAAVRPAMGRFSLLLGATVALLLFSGCITVGMLLLIRTEARRGELAMCIALGASRARLARGIVLEGALLASAGSLAAVPVAWWLFRLVQSFELPGSISIELLELSLDAYTVAACIAAGSGAVVLIGAVACILGLRGTAGAAPRPRGGATPRVTGRVTRSALVAAQVAITVALVAAAGLLARSLIAALSLNPELDMSRTVLGTIQLAPYGYSPERAGEFFARLGQELERLPSVDTAALSRWEGGMSPMGRVRVDGVPRQFPSTIAYIRVDPAFFRVMNIRLVEGRPFERDDRQGSVPVAIVSESLARLIGDGLAIGHRLSRLSDSDPPVQVVGVASDVITNVLLLEPLVVYMPASQGAPAVYRDFAIRAKGNPATAKAQLLAAVRGLDPQVTPTPPRTLEERISEQMAPQHLGATILGALGAIALLLTLLGTYVLAEAMAFARTREMGIRAALGATPRQLGAIVITETGRLIGAGLVAGLALAWTAMGIIRSFLFQVGPLDPATLAVVLGGIFVLALAVSFRAAVRVGSVNLAQVLRAE